MTNYREILRLKNLGINNKQIAESMRISRQTVVSVLQRAATMGITWAEAEPLTNKDLWIRLSQSNEGKVEYKMPDYDYIHRELMKPGVTQQLLWMEYCEQCRASGELPFQLTAFKTYYRMYAAKTKATMHISHRPGEVMEVDWAGQTAEMTDTDTGEIIPVNVFVAVLPYSGYAYAEAFMLRDQEAWSAAHVNAYRYFGGVTRLLVPDNLKTGVTKHVGADLELNKNYQELAEHYGTAIMPTRVYSPKDKATVEGTVGNVSTFILAAIRNQKFFSLMEINNAIKDRLHILNNKPFQRKEGSRTSWFAEERMYLLPLPRNPFELAIWKVATVAFNYHISVDTQHYSAPYEFIKRKVDVRMTRNTVEIFFEGQRICSHARLYGRSGQYSTQEVHMPPNHQEYLKWNGDRFRSWANKIGKNTVIVVESILTSHKVEQQGYRACMALLKMSDQYSHRRLESACARALEYSPQPSFKIVQSILRAGIDKIIDEAQSAQAPSAFGFTRGADYYKNYEGVK